MGRALVSAGTLYVVATPLGNLGDLSERAAHVLGQVALVAAEDTRRTRVLLLKVGASPRVFAVHAHSPQRRLEQVLTVLERGENVALVTDAGTPGVSDPGALLTTQAHDRGIPVRVVPGPSAVAAALSVSGFPADRFTFLGFLPRSGAPRRELLAATAASRWTTVMFEAPVRLVALLADLAAACGGSRRAAVARELTKVHEELRRGTLDELAVYYEESPPRGEVTVVIDAAPRHAERKAVRVQDSAAMARALLDEGWSRRDAAKRLAEELGVPRNEAYRIVSAL
ncbi:MAG TPA: 16S rRNA (cytidine(1402)-2'-O)-methyltransferase [Gemmatimonadales bacterium]